MRSGGPTGNAWRECRRRGGPPHRATDRPNLGDVIADDDDLYGDGVNIAARIEALADAGGVFVSGTVYGQVRDRLPLGFEDRGEQQVKNITRPVRVYRAVLDRTVSASRRTQLPLLDKPSIAVLPFQNMSNDP